MKIESYNIEQMSASKFHRMEKSQINIQIQNPQNEHDFLDVSEEGIALNEVEENELFALSEEDQRKIELLETFISWLTGKEFKFDRMYQKDKKGLHENKINNRRENGNGFAMRINTMHEIHEKEKMSFSSAGVVKTSDGKEINFTYNLNMSRETYERSEILFEVGKFHDPLVLNFDGEGIDFGDEKIRIDIDLDGELDNIAAFAEGTGLLALDNNGNGVVDDGTELFGPTTNDGFGELREYDSDGNSWIDENDDIFNSLKIWTVHSDGSQDLIGLKEAGVGAIYLGNVASSYSVVGDEGKLAEIKGSSIYLSEEGEVNAIHEIDLKL